MSGTTWMRAVSFAAPQRGSGGEDDFVPELKLEELPRSLTGHMNLILLERNKVGGFARSANYDSQHQFQSSVYQYQGEGVRRPLLQQRLTPDQTWKLLYSF